MANLVIALTRLTGLLLSTASPCSTGESPDVTQLMPDTVAPGDFVKIGDNGMLGGIILWDADFASPRRVAGGTEVKMFTVPIDASYGTHKIGRLCTDGTTTGAYKEIVVRPKGLMVTPVDYTSPYAAYV